MKFDVATILWQYRQEKTYTMLKDHQETFSLCHFKAKGVSHLKYVHADMHLYDTFVQGCDNYIDCIYM